MKKAILLLIAAATLPLCAQVKITKSADKISIEIGGKPFTDFYYTGSDVKKPYLHPLRASDGTIMTRMYPMTSDVPGEAHDHPHHRGLWFTHGDVNGYDFWANEPSQGSQKKGQVLLKNIGEVKSGKKSGDIAATFDWDDPAGKPLLTESRKMTFYSDPKLRIIDFDVTFKALQKVTFGDTKEGTFAIRVAPWLEEKMPRSPAQPPRTGKMVTGDGREGEKQIWGKRAAWVDYFGQHDGQTHGIAIFDHPSNPKHPTYWHSRSYGLFAANIFGEHDFYNDKSRNGSVTIEPGQTLRFRYRVVIHPGDTKQADIAKLYDQYKGGS